MVRAHSNQRGIHLPHLYGYLEATAAVTQSPAPAEYLAELLHMARTAKNLHFSVSCLVISPELWEQRNKRYCKHDKPTGTSSQSTLKVLLDVSNQKPQLTHYFIPKQ